MLSILSNNRDIYFNLALEEYWLKKRDEDIMMVWQSDTSVVIGKHQNTYAEINNECIRKHHIPVARRLSGGGTVYHDPGNLNFTIIMNGEPGKLVNFQRFVSPVILYLKTLGIEAEMGMHNELLIDGIKISGNAEHVFKKRVLHHGTLLFNSDLELLHKVIKVPAGRYIDKAVHSNRAEVGNISGFLSDPLSFDEFTLGLYRFLKEYFKIDEDYSLDSHELHEITNLRDSRYTTREWIYNYSPPFKLVSKFKIGNSELKAEFNIEKGMIKSVTFIGNNREESKEILFKQLVQLPFEYLAIRKSLKDSGNLSDEQITEILKRLF